MVLEATMVCIDNSEFTRNGDYQPNRMAAIKDAANMLATGKCNQNPESAVGILAMAGERIELVATPSPDQGRILSGINDIKVRGSCNIVSGIKVGQLALKHRMNKNQRQRIVVFVASPIKATVKELETLGKNLKKNNVSIDIISIGEVEDNKEKIAKLHEAANSNGTSNILEVPQGMTVLSNAVVSSTIMHPDGAPPAAAGGDGGFGFGGMEENDPELAMALRISMEEERARQGGGDGGGDGGGAGSPASPQFQEDVGMAGMDDDLDEELRQALAMSLAEVQPSPAAETPAATTSNDAQPPEPKKAKTGEQQSASADAPATNDANLFLDDAFVENFLGTLPGVDVNDPKIQAALKGAKGDDADKDKKDGDKDKKDGDKK
eukprot:gene788-839_t